MPDPDDVEVASDSAAATSTPSSSAERSLALLALVAAEGRALSLAELSARLALPKAGHAEQRHRARAAP